MRSCTDAWKRSESAGARRAGLQPLGGLLLVAIASLVQAGVGSSQDLSWDRLAEGLDVAVWKPGMACEEQVPSSLLVKVDPEHFRFSVYHYQDEKLLAPLTIKEWQRRTSATILFNAGLFRDDYSYMGLLLKNGRSLGTGRHPHWHGLFVAEPVEPGAKKARIVDLATESFTVERPGYREAAQSLMLLDRSGKPRVRQTGKRAYQTVIAETRDGHILVIKPVQEVALWELAECLRTALPFIAQAMAMDGGSSSDLLISSEVPARQNDRPGSSLWQTFRSFVDGSGMGHIPLPAVIGVLPREK